ncbi:MAG: CHAT domain-containing tetratricopeptide repeat protein, partial [Nitrospirota bacterium]
SVLLFSATTTPAYPEEVYEIIQKGTAKESLQRFEEKARNLESKGKLKKASEAYLKASNLARASGNYQKGILFGTKATEIGEKINNPEIQARASIFTALSYIKVADHERARLLLEKGAVLASQLDMKGLEAKAYEHMGNIYRKLSNPQKALEYHKKAYSVYERLVAAVEEPEVSPTTKKGRKRAERRFSDPRFVRNFIDVAIAIGNTYKNLDDYASALDYFDKALFYAQGIKDKELKAYMSIGDIYFRKGNYHKALEYHKKSCELSDSINIPWLTISTYSKAATDYRMLGKLENAIDHYKKAIDAIEDTRTMLQSEEMRSSFFEQTTKTYDGMISTLMALGKTEDAFNFSERVRARTFLDILGNKIDLSRGKATSLAEEEIELRRKINALQLKLEETDDIEIKNELDETKRQYNRFLERLRKEDLEHASLVSVEPFTIKDVQSLLEPEKTLIEFHVLKGMTIRWTIKKNSMQSVTIKHSRKDILEKVNSLRESISDISSEDRFKAVSRELYSILIKDAGIKKGDELIIVPHDLLHYLPFHAFVTPEGRYLIEDHIISYLSSASLIRFTAEKRKKIGENVLAFGNPDLGNPVYNLRYAEREAKEIARIYPKSEIYLRKDATESRAKERPNRYSILHFASHGEFSEQNPMESSLRLARDEREDGNLSTEEIFRLNINASLVVLSACETAIGRISSGDEIIGLTRAFIYAGTPSIITTLWKVNDKTTFMLMRDFYQNLKTMRKAEALRTAQNNLMKNYHHPFFWGAFVLTGDAE